jgi:hypothetical protein
MSNDRDIFLISIFTFFTVVSWIFFELVKTTRTSTVTTNVQQIITPLSPTIDTEVFTVLENRRSY